MSENVMDFMEFDPADKQAAWTAANEEGLFAVIGEGTAIKWAASGEGLEKNVQAHAEALKNGGVSTFEITARYKDWVEALNYIPDGVTKAVGTHANIVTIYQGIKGGAILNVAAHALNPLAGYRSVPNQQREVAREVEGYIKTHIDEFASRLNLTEQEKKVIMDNPLSMDPIDFGNAHNSIIMPAGFTPTEIYNLIQRGAIGQKAFPFGDRTPEKWNGMFAAMSDVYKKDAVICATGGVKAETLSNILSVNYVEMAGASSLVGTTPNDTYNRAVEMRAIATKAKGK